MPFTRTTLAVAAAFGLAVSAAPGLAMAGQAPVTMAQASTPAKPQSFSDEKLQAFASAAVQVRDIRKEHAAKIQGVTDEQKQAEMVDAAVQKMTKVVEDEPGITVAEYNQINQAIPNDPALAQKVQTYVQEAGQ